MCGFVARFVVNATGSVENVVEWKLFWNNVQTKCFYVRENNDGVGDIYCYQAREALCKRNPERIKLHGEPAEKQ